MKIKNVYNNNIINNMEKIIKKVFERQNKKELLKIVIEYYEIIETYIKEIENLKKNKKNVVVVNMIAGADIKHDSLVALHKNNKVYPAILKTNKYEKIKR